MKIHILKIYINSKIYSKIHLPHCLSQNITIENISTVIRTTSYTITLSSNNSIVLFLYCNSNLYTTPYYCKLSWFFAVLSVSFTLSISPENGVLERGYDIIYGSV